MILRLWRAVLVLDTCQQPACALQKDVDGFHGLGRTVFRAIPLHFTELDSLLKLSAQPPLDSIEKRNL
eukprot:472133-Amphidinium_carterae.1